METPSSSSLYTIGKWVAPIGFGILLAGLTFSSVYSMHDGSYSSGGNYQYPYSSGGNYQYPYSSYGNYPYGNSYSYPTSSNTYNMYPSYSMNSYGSPYSYGGSYSMPYAQGSYGGSYSYPYSSYYPYYGYYPYSYASYYPYYYYPYYYPYYSSYSYYPYYKYKYSVSYSNSYSCPQTNTQYPPPGCTRTCTTDWQGCKQCQISCAGTTAGTTGGTTGGTGGTGGCYCPAVYSPVTCSDGRTYSNSCYAQCAGQTQCSGMSSSTSSQQGTTDVTIQNFQFTPSNITVKVGTTVRWTNNSQVGHTVTGNYGGPSSGLFGPGQTYSYTFTTPGTFSYYCQPHPHMTGSITVVP